MFRKDGLMVIPAGSKTLNPSDVLSSERMKLLVTHLKENFDYVVIEFTSGRPGCGFHYHREPGR